MIERCITRCIENEATELWLQTTLSMPQAHKLYYKLGFADADAPKQMDVLGRTQKIMFKSLPSHAASTGEIAPFGELSP